MENDKTYVIVEMDDITENMVDESISNRKNHLVSLDGRSVVLKFKMPHPNTTATLKKRTQQEMLTFLDTNKALWFVPISPSGV